MGTSALIWFTLLSLLAEILGTVGGFGSGVVIRGLTLSAFNTQKNVFIATSAVIDLAMDLSRGPVYVTNGYVYKHDLYLIVILVVVVVVVSIVGTLIGKKLSTISVRPGLNILSLH